MCYTPLQPHALPLESPATRQYLAMWDEGTSPLLTGLSVFSPENERYAGKIHSEYPSRSHRRQCRKTNATALVGTQYIETPPCNHEDHPMKQSRSYTQETRHEQYAPGTCSERPREVHVAHGRSAPSFIYHVDFRLVSPLLCPSAEISWPRLSINLEVYRGGPWCVGNSLCPQ